jgi:YtkA-like protein
MKPVALCLSMAVVVSLASCTRAAEESNLIELQRVHSGDLDVVLLSNDGTLSHGKDSFVIEFRRGNDLVDVGAVKASATMVMAGMAPMLGSVFLEKGDKPGRYKADTDLSMSGGWQLKLEWDGPAGKGNASMQATAD